MNYVSETEKKIIAAATEVFLLKGRDGARMQEIADHAGINKALLHYYFRSKDKLYEEVFINQLREFFHSVLTALQEHDDFTQALRVFIDRYMELVAKHAEMFRFVLWEIEAGGELISKAILAELSSHEITKNPFVTRIERAIADQQIRAVEPMNLVVSVIGMCVFPFLARSIIERIFPQIRVNSPEFFLLRKQEVFNLIWQGIATSNTAVEN